MSGNDTRAIHLPYCLKKPEDGRYVVLNRDYKPLGFDTQDWLDYNAYPIPLKFKNLTEEVASRISHKGSKERDMIFFYDDGCIPTHAPEHMTAYLERLRVFAKLKIVG